MIDYPPLMERAAGLDALQALQYGRLPPARDVERMEELLPAVDGRRLVRLHAGPWYADVLWHLPPGPGPHPLVIALNFNGNHTTSDDPAIPLPPHPVLEDMARGEAERRWPFARLRARGVSVATMCCSQALVDNADPAVQDAFPGIRALGGPKRWADRGSDAYGAIAAWAWTLSLLRRWFASRPEIDASRIAVFGHSRLGKAALLAGALDTAFVRVGATGSGTGGQSPSRKTPDAADAESAERIQRVFPHWFCPAFTGYAADPATLPFDQHQLLAAIAPRPLVLIDGVEDRWADPEGASRMARLAAPAWGSAPGPRWVLRPGIHDVLPEDWDAFLDGFVP